MAGIPGSPNPFLTLGKLVAALVAAGVLVAGLALPYVGGLGLVAGHEADRFRDTACNLQESKPPQRTTLYANDNRTVIATLFSQDRVPVPLAQIPTYLQDALVATEDRRFYTHHGVDMRGLLRSAVSTTSGDTQGGSTLTMQYVKQIRYYQAGDDLAKQNAAIDQNLQRKIEDAKCALYIEGTLHESKGKILTNYLNIAFFGEHAYGIQTAAETYFNKPASKLTLAESALLVGMLRAPSAYDPFLDRAAAKDRRDQVLQNLVDVGKLGQVEANRQKALPIALATNAPPQVKQGCANAATTIRNAAFFCEYTRSWLENVNKISDNELQTGGLRIVTTLDKNIQNTAQARVEKLVPARSPMTSVLPVVDPKSGNILAMATSKHYGTAAGETEQRVFTSHVAQAASTFKLFPLLTALQTGVPDYWKLETVGGQGSYTTKNCLVKSKSSNGDADESYNINESLRSATVKSSNTFFVGFADQFLGCKLMPMITLAQRLGIASLGQPGDLPKLTLGEEINAQQQAQRFVLGSVPASPLELAGAYAAVANDGRYNAPAPVSSITDSSGNALPVRRTGAVQVVAPQVARQAVDILTGDTQGDGTSSAPFQNWDAQGHSIVAGKTGTVGAVDSRGRPSDKNAAIWFVGMTPDLVATSALINFDFPFRASTGLPGIKNGTAYGKYASSIWLKALDTTLANRTWQWKNPADVAGTDVPDITGLSIDDAKRRLAESGFTLRLLGTSTDLCPSNQPLETIGYYGPQRATTNTPITACISSGKPQQVYTPPVYVPPYIPRRNSSGSSRSTTRSSAPAQTSSAAPPPPTSAPAPPKRTKTRGR